MDALTGTTIPASLAEAVDVLVAEYGVGGAERELQARFAEQRAIAALAYLRRKYDA